MGGQLPKVLVMLKNKPLILYLLEEIEKISQLAKPVIVVGYEAEKVKAVLGDQYMYAHQHQQLGTADAVKVALEKVSGENILVLYGDHPLTKADSLKNLMRLHQEKNSKISMFTTTVPNFEGWYKPFEHFGRVVREGDRVKKIVEFKDADNNLRQQKEVNPGIYMFNTDWLKKHLPKISNQNAQSEYLLTDIVEVAIAHGEVVEAASVPPEEVLGVNTPDDLKLAEVLMD